MYCVNENKDAKLVLLSFSIFPSISPFNITMTARIDVRSACGSSVFFCLPLGFTLQGENQRKF